VEISEHFYKMMAIDGTPAQTRTIYPQYCINSETQELWLMNDKIFCIKSDSKDHVILCKWGAKLAIFTACQVTW